RTGGGRTLDDVVRHLWRAFGEPGRGYGDDDVQREAERAVEVDLSATFDACVRGREDPDLGGGLGARGYTLRPKKQEDDDKNGAWLGVSTKNEGGRLIVQSVPSGSPAERGGIYAGDEIAAIDGLRVDDKALGERLGSRKPGQAARFTLF